MTTTGAWGTIERRWNDGKEEKEKGGFVEDPGRRKQDIGGRKLKEEGSLVSDHRE